MCPFSGLLCLCVACVSKCCGRLVQSTSRPDPPSSSHKRGCTDGAGSGGVSTALDTVHLHAPIEACLQAPSQNSCQARFARWKTSATGGSAESRALVQGITWQLCCCLMQMCLQIKVERVLVGSFCTSLDMQGLSLSLLRLDRPEWAQLLDAPAQAMHLLQMRSLMASFSWNRIQGLGTRPHTHAQDLQAFSSPACCACSCLPLHSCQVCFCCCDLVCSHPPPAAAGALAQSLLLWGQPNWTHLLDASAEA